MQVSAKASKCIAINAFTMASPGQSWAGLWAHPDSQGERYNDLDYWIELARLCERGLIDAIFFADILGSNDVYGGRPDAALRSGCMMPNNDPMMLISAMAAASRNLCFGITGNTTYENPYLLARRFSTLDHLTKGRVAWNVVTGILASTAKAVGLDHQVEHDKRYDMADEYMALVYKLWEESWDSDAAVRDRDERIFTNPAGVHQIEHKGTYYRCEGVHLSEPSPQRTPLIYVAGSSPRGRAFAGQHAECAFMATNDLALAKRTSAAYRNEALRAGRKADSIKIFNAATIIVGRTEAEAREIEREVKNYSDEAGNLAMFSQWLGVDLAKYDPDEPLRYVESNAIKSLMDALANNGGGKEIRIRELGGFGQIPGRDAYFIGSAEQVCDQLIHWTEEADIDGFNLVRTVEPACLQAFVNLVVPELQARGAYKTSYAPGTMREKFFPDAGSRLPAEHRARKFAKIALNSSREDNNATP